MIHKHTQAQSAVNSYSQPVPIIAESTFSSQIGSAKTNEFGGSNKFSMDQQQQQQANNNNNNNNINNNGGGGAGGSSADRMHNALLVEELEASVSRAEKLLAKFETSTVGDYADGLFEHGACHWPNCPKNVKNIHEMSRHLHDMHPLSQKSISQLNSTMFLIEDLHKRLLQQRALLKGMVDHLQACASSCKAKSANNAEMRSPSLPAGVPSFSQLPFPMNSLQFPVLANLSQTLLPVSTTMHMTTNGTNGGSLFGLQHRQNNFGRNPSDPGLNLLDLEASNNSHLDSTESPNGGNGSLDTSFLKQCDPPVRLSGRGKDVSAYLALESAEMRNYYRHTNQRPPDTYVNLIRQAIVESAEHQLTLNEIYNWLQREFCFFRNCEPTWKNAIRHNLSMHKFFVRLENAKGSFWTVNESEFDCRRAKRTHIYKALTSEELGDDMEPLPKMPTSPMCVKTEANAANHGECTNGFG